MSICNCILVSKKPEAERHNVAQGILSGFKKMTQVLTYQLKDSDINHLMDIAKFFKDHSELCVSDITNGKKVQVKVTEYGPEMLKSIRRQSGFNDDYLIKAFAPNEN